MTPAEAQKLQDKIFKKMTASEKLKLVDQFFKLGMVLNKLNDRKINGSDRTSSKNNGNIKKT